MIPERLKNKDFRFCLIRPRDKRPFENDWQNTSNYTYDNPRLLEHIANGGNYGIVCGFGNLLIIDFDDESVQKDIEPLLPKTFTVKTGRGLMHKYFICDDPEPMKVLNESKDTLADIQGIGKQIIAPSSTHPNGNKYEVLVDLPIAEIGIAEVKALFSKYKKFEDTEDKRLRNNKKEDVVADIKFKVSVPQLLSNYGVNTNKNPTNCPLHSSKGGKCLSFKEDIWHCFHCEKGGDVITLRMEQEGNDFKKVLDSFCNELGIQKRKIMSKSIKVDEEYEKVMQLREDTPFFFDRSNLFWFWNKDKFKWEIVDEVDLLNELDEQFELNGEIISSQQKMKYINSFKQIGRKFMPEEAPSTWIQFRNKIFDIKSKKTFEATAEYFFTNPIPWDIGESSETPKIDELLTSWVGEDYLETMYEIIAYCCIRDYPIHVMFCMIGAGRNGKSTFQRLITKYIGKDNLSSTELDDLLESRFESIGLYKKLVCIMGETNFGTLSKTSLIKKLCGQDLVKFEFKGKNRFEDYNYAKIIIASNSLPSSNDQSEGFYRRWLIIDFPNNFNEGIDVLSSFPEAEFNNLSNKIIGILPKLLEKGKFTNQGTIEQRRDRYIEASNPFVFFIRDCCSNIHTDSVKYNEFYSAYLKYLKIQNKRRVSRKEFRKVLDDEGIDVEKTSRDGQSGFYAIGIKLLEDWEEKVTKVTKVTSFQSNLHAYRPSGNYVTNVTNVTNFNENKTLFINTPKFADIFANFLEIQQPTESVIELCKSHGMSEREAELFINESKKQGIIFEPKSGFLEVLR